MPAMHITAKELIIRRLEQSDRPLAVHEFDIAGYNENNLATRVSELARTGRVIGVRRPGCSFKEWSLTAVPSKSALCQICGNSFDPEIDPYHREACRDANKP